MSRRGRFPLVLALVLAAALPSAQRSPSPDPILILTSFDGWRYDYGDRLPAALESERRDILKRLGA